VWVASYLRFFPWGLCSTTDGATTITGGSAFCSAAMVSGKLVWLALSSPSEKTKIHFRLSEDFCFARHSAAETRASYSRVVWWPVRASFAAISSGSVEFSSSRENSSLKLTRLPTSEAGLNDFFQEVEPRRSPAVQCLLATEFFHSLWFRRTYCVAGAVPACWPYTASEKQNTIGRMEIFISEPRVPPLT